jgi:hypothetical protein
MKEKSQITSIIFIILSYIFLLSGTYLYPMYPINSFNDALDILSNADSNSLIIFDIDDTLISPSSRIMRSSIIEAQKEKIHSLLSNSHLNAPLLTQGQWNDLHSIRLLQEEYILIEPKIQEIIKLLQNNSCIVLGITTAPSYLLGDKGCIPELRYNTLKKLNIDFSTSQTENITRRVSKKKHSHVPPIVMDYQEGNYNYYPTLYKGILLTDSLPKGKGLDLLLNTTNLNPANILFFDDNQDNLESLAQMARKHTIPFIGFNYRGAEKFNIPLDENIAQTQLYHLINKGEWLSEKGALTFNPFLLFCKEIFSQSVS